MAAPINPQGVCELRVGEMSSRNMKIHTRTHTMHVQPHWCLYLGLESGLDTEAWEHRG